MKFNLMDSDSDMVIVGKICASFYKGEKDAGWAACIVKSWGLMILQRLMLPLSRHRHG